MRPMQRTHAHRLSGSIVIGAMLAVLTAGSAMAETESGRRPDARVSDAVVVDRRVELSLADIYAGYADAETVGRTQARVSDAAVVDGRVELSLADIYAGYADADPPRAELSLADIYAGYADADPE